MKKKLVLVGTVIILVFSQFSFPLVNEEKSVLLKFSEDFKVESERLNQMSERFKRNEVTQSELQFQHLITRNQYKRIEFIYEYLYPEYAKSHFNGAPLLQLKRHDSKPFVVPPEGMQILDELIYGDLEEKDRLQISILAQKLAEHASIINEQIKNETLSKGDIIVAMRLELVRLFSLGLTGFDTPGSLNAIQEAKTVLNSLKIVLESIQGENDYRLSIDLLEESEKYLDKYDNFNSLDRLTFLMRYINPLYKNLNLNLETSRLPITSWNPKSQNIFSTDFLNPYFFSDLKKNEDSELKKKVGEKLFYDLTLSKNGEMSCASCHNPKLAFTDGLKKSESNVEGETVLRNSPTLLNAVYADRFFYDLRAFSLEQQSQHVIFNHQEFNTANDEIVGKLNNNKEYKELFSSAFSDQKINVKNFSQALASYVLSLQALNSKFDQHIREEADVLNDSEKRGFNLFMGKANCGTCHFAPTFSGLIPPLYRENESEILGVLKDPKALNKEVDDDLGRIANQLYSESAWIYQKSFKTVTVRNVGLTAPYFHNGAYTTLNEVMDFYNRGGGLGHGFDVVNQTLSEDELELSKTEINDIVAFMNSLTDTSSVKY